ncbi:MAG: CoA transferase [Actinomycetota bacterium]|nr:CoA transferase [Actinomycetota bacterium]
MSGPLYGVRILDLTRLLPGNYCTLLLADLGADVVKVEEPGRGDYIRFTPPMVGAEGSVHRALNRGKRSIAINLKADGGPELLRRLARDAAAVVESFRPGVLDRLGAGFAALSEENPRLVYCAITGYGQDGPYRDRAGHDINYTGYTGVLHNSGAPDGPPVMSSVQIGDFGGGMAAALGIAAALSEAERTGTGRLVDVSMMDVVMSWSGVLLSSYLATGVVPSRGRTPLGGGLACYRVYRAGDGGYLAVGALEPRFWRALCDRIGLPELIDIQHHPSRQDEIAKALQRRFEERSRDEWVSELADLDTCVGPVNDIGQAAADPQVRHRGSVVEVGGEPVGPGAAIKLEGADPTARRPAPALGEHTDEVLGEAGLSADEIDRLRASGVL